MPPQYRKELFDIEYEILREHSKRQVIKIGALVGNDRRRFAKLMDLFLHGEHQVTQRSVWMVSYCIERHPELLDGWIPAMLEKMQEKGVHNAVPRNVLRILKDADIPRSSLGMVVTLCFSYAINPKLPNAIQVNAMYVLANAAAQEPGLIHEIEETLQHIPGASPGIRACASKVMKKIQRIKERGKI
ncbi:MAG: hypothetical protein ACHQQQ_14350 [Bacteroidota bacterium]